MDPDGNQATAFGRTDPTPTPEPRPGQCTCPKDRLPGALSSELIPKAGPLGKEMGILDAHGSDKQNPL